MDLRPWNYWTRDGLSERRHAGSDRVAAARAVGEPIASRRAALLDSPVGADEDAGAGGEGSRSAAAADARGRSHHPHAGAHLHARRPLRRCGEGQPAGGRGRRGLHRPVQGAGDVSARLLPAQHPLHLDGRDDVRAECAWRIAAARKVAAAIPPRRWPLCRRSRASSSCPTGRWCVRASGTRSSPNRLRPTIRSSRAGCGTTRAAGRLPGKGRLDDAEQELAALDGDRHGPALPTLPASASLNTPDAILRIAPEVLAGEIAREAKDLDRRAAAPRTGRPARGRADLHGAADWPSPVRQVSARRCSKPDRAVEAEAVYWDDLRRNPGERLVALRPAAAR